MDSSHATHSTFEFQVPCGPSHPVIVEASIWGDVRLAADPIDDPRCAAACQREVNRCLEESRACYQHALLPAAGGGLAAGKGSPLSAELAGELLRFWRPPRAVARSLAGGLLEAAVRAGELPPADAELDRPEDAAAPAWESLGRVVAAALRARRRSLIWAALTLAGEYRQAAELIESRVSWLPLLSAVQAVTVLTEMGHPIRDRGLRRLLADNRVSPALRRQWCRQISKDPDPFAASCLFSLATARQGYGAIFPRDDRLAADASRQLQSRLLALAESPERLRDYAAELFLLEGPSLEDPLVALGAKQAPVWLELLRHRRTRVRVQSLRVLSRLRSPALVAPLLDSLDSLLADAGQTREVREAMEACVLACLADFPSSPQVKRRLPQLLESQNRAVFRAAVRLIPSVGRRRQAQLVREAVEHRQVECVVEAVEQLLRLGEGAMSLAAKAKLIVAQLRRFPRQSRLVKTWCAVVAQAGPRDRRWLLQGAELDDDIAARACVERLVAAPAAGGVDLDPRGAALLQLTGRWERLGLAAQSAVADAAVRRRRFDALPALIAALRTLVGAAESHAAEGDRRRAVSAACLRRTIIALLGGIEAEDVAWVGVAAACPDAEIRAAAGRAIGRAGDPAWLLDVVRAGPPEAREQAAAALARQAEQPLSGRRLSVRRGAFPPQTSPGAASRILPRLGRKPPPVGSGGG